MTKRLSNLTAPLVAAVVGSCLYAGCAPTTTEAPPPTASTAPATTTAAAAIPAPTGAAAPTPAANACAFPTKAAATPEETMWQIFVALNCSTGNPAAPPLVWETWTEQTCLSAPSAPGCGPGIASVHASRHLHGSVLSRRRANVDPSNRLGGDCADMTTVASAKKNAPGLVPFVPKNLAPGAKFCEEVYSNASEVAYIKAPAAGSSLLTLTQQQTFLSTKATIAFPTESVEVKADWLPAAALSPSPDLFDCKKPSPGLHVEMIADKCYALVGMHVSSKLLPDWMWATFEPQSDLTNPNRCNAALYSNCNDPWGSTPAISTGKPTAQTPALIALMAQAKLLPEFANYRLVGAQTTFTSPTMLGSSFVEFNAEVPPQQASCITCHNYATIAATSPAGANPENPNFGAFPGTPPTGTPGPFPAPAKGYGPWTQQDFSWMLATMPIK